MSQETRHHFREELASIETSVLESLDMVLEALDGAAAALEHHDVALATEVIAADAAIDERYLEVHEGILSLIAREAPVATDLRLVSALLHTIRHIERMGDQCVNICKLVPVAGNNPPVQAEILDRILAMLRLLRTQIIDARRCFAERDTVLAGAIARADVDVNRLNREIFRVALELGSDYDTREWAMLMMLTARCLERIGDNAVDICEHVIFIVTGQVRELSDARFGATAGRS